MNKMLQPTGAVLVGLALFLSCISLQICQAVPTAVSYPESLNGIREFHNQFTSPTYFASFQGPSKLPEQAIFMKGPSQSLEGLISFGGAKHRSIAFDGLLDSTGQKMNAMDIQVTGITVIAINMGEGGSAVATSDIVLRPVQSLGVTVLSSEVVEKLK
jgi:hypothetical protein